MAERFERSIQDWYQNSRTADLEFLNIANPNLADLSNNVTILYDKLLLHSKISIKHFYQLQEVLSKQTDALEERLRKIEDNQTQILSSLNFLEEKILSRKTLTQNEVLTLVHKTTSQPTKHEQEALSASVTSVFLTLYSRQFISFRGSIAVKQNL